MKNIAFLNSKEAYYGITYFFLLKAIKLPTNSIWNGLDLGVIHWGKDLCLILLFL